MTETKVDLPSLIARHSPDQIETLVSDRLSGRSRSPLLRADREETPEEVVVWLLRENISAEMRKAVVVACRNVGMDVMEQIVSEQPFDAAFFTLTERWANVLDRAAPQELKAVAKANLQAALDAHNVSPAVLDAIVRATLRFRLEEMDAELWLQLLRRRDLCAYGFNALLKINPKSPRIVQALFGLWRRNVDDGWPVNVELLTANMIRAQKTDDIFINLLLTDTAIRDENLSNAILARLSASRLQQLNAIGQNILLQKPSSRVFGKTSSRLSESDFESYASKFSDHSSIELIENWISPLDVSTLTMLRGNEFSIRVAHRHNPSKRRLGDVTSRVCGGFLEPYADIFNALVLSGQTTPLKHDWLSSHTVDIQPANLLQSERNSFLETRGYELETRFSENPFAYDFDKALA